MLASTPSADATVEYRGLPLLAPATFMAVGAVLVWFAVQLAGFIGEAPDLDAMVGLRESIVFHRHGLAGLVAEHLGTGVHPPLLEMLSAVAFTLFGEAPGSQQLIAIALFAFVAAASERLLAPWLGAGERVAAALVIAICPSLAISLFCISREGLVIAILLPALALGLAPGDAVPGRMAALGGVLALLPLAKENGLVLVVPFAVFVVLAGPGSWAGRLRRGAVVAAIPLGAALVWRMVLGLAGGTAWHAWIFSTHPGEGPYAVALRAMFGLEHGIYLRQNLANGLIVNFLWVPTLVAMAAVVRLTRQTGPPGLRRAAALVGGLAAMYTWTALAFPTFTVPRYAAPLSLLVILLGLLGLPVFPSRARRFVLGALLAGFAAGAWSPTDPVSRVMFGTTSVGGEQIYDTDPRERGPDRMVINFAVLRAGERMNRRLQRLYASDADLVAGDCDAMKLGEKLSSIGSAPGAYDRGLPGARPLRCVQVDQLPPDALNTRKIALVRTVEDQIARRPLPVSGPFIVIH